jgi:hypothetical protein
LDVVVGLCFGGIEIKVSKGQSQLGRMLFSFGLFETDCESEKRDVQRRESSEVFRRVRRSRKAERSRRKLCEAVCLREDLMFKPNVDVSESEIHPTHQRSWSGCRQNESFVMSCGGPGKVIARQDDMKTCRFWPDRRGDMGESFGGWEI